MIPAVPPDQRPVDPPPLHIRMTNEYPVNPRGKSQFGVVGVVEGIEEDVQEFGIVSDTDEWALSEFDMDAIDEPPDPPGYVQTSDVPPGYWQEWLTAVSCDDSIYIPQIGDEVAFIKQGYLKMIHESDLNEDVSKLEELEGTEKMSVVNIDPVSNGMKLTVQLLKDGQRKDKYSVFFPIPETVQFMLPSMKFRTSHELMKVLQVGDTVSVPFYGENGVLTSYTGTIRAIRPNWSQEPFEALSVSWEGEEGNISPWEITSRNGEPAVGQDQSFTISRVADKVKEDLVRILSDPKYQEVAHCPDPRVETGIEQIIKIPSSVVMIKERLESSWYRTFLGIVADIRLIGTNIQMIRQSGDPQVELAGEIVRQLTGTLENLSRLLKERREQMKRQQEMMKRQTQ